jgi:Activator of Hsp90 ATPase homolog 1-like protein
MKTLFAQSSDVLMDAEHGRPQPDDAESALTFKVSVNADRRRVFHVLTISEYMETWLTVPGRRQKSPINVASHPAGFQIQYIDEQGSPTSLCASYQTCRTAKTQFFWRRKGTSESDSSFVRIRLNGDFERTTLCLTHSGLGSEVDRRWHSQLWGESLKKLGMLFELQ